MTKVNPEFIREFRNGNDFNATACMNCGTCTALCPIGLENMPRELFRYVVLGLEDKLIENTETVFSCLLCRMCEDNCPGEVHIVKNVRAVRNYLNRKVHKL